MRLFFKHLPVYCIEAWGLGLFMVSAACFTILIEHPDLWFRQQFEDIPIFRRSLIGLAMGLTAVGIIYSPWGKRSGAHLNPAVTLTFYRLGKISKLDTFFYVIFQSAGGLAGIYFFKFFLKDWIAHPAVNYVITKPGAWGVAGAFVLEALLSFLLFITVLLASNIERFIPMTGLFAGIWLWIFITLEAPYSGMSINPARTLASALPSGIWSSIWIYFVAPPVGMLIAGEVYSNFCRYHKFNLKCHMSGRKHDCPTYLNTLR